MSCLAFRRVRLSVALSGQPCFQAHRSGHILRQQNDVLKDTFHSRQQFGTQFRETVNQRLQVSDLAKVVRKEVSRLVAEHFDNPDEIFDVKPTLIHFQSRQLRRRDPSPSRHLSLRPSFRFPEFPKDLAVHGGIMVAY